jgi:hypothetical protein
MGIIIIKGEVARLGTPILLWLTTSIRPSARLRNRRPRSNCTRRGLPDSSNHRRNSIRTETMVLEVTLGKAGGGAVTIINTVISTTLAAIITTAEVITIKISTKGDSKNKHFKSYQKSSFQIKTNL